jgi:hypothetical protein
MAIALGASLPVALGIISFAYQQRWARRDSQRRAREDRILAYLTDAYTSLCAIMPAGGVGYLTIQEKQNLEAAFRDAFLYGNEKVTAALGTFMDEFATKHGGTSIDDLLAALRSQLRAMMSLSDIGEDKADQRQAETPWIVTGWRDDARISAMSGDRTIELLTSEEAVSITGIDINELLSYARAGRMPQPVVVDGNLRWIASAIRSLARDLSETPIANSGADGSSLA